MPDYQTHFNQARHNLKQSFNSFDQAALDWSVTEIFYTALHISEGSFVLHGSGNTQKSSYDNSIHEAVISNVRKHFGPQAQHIYRLFYNESMNARYLREIQKGTAYEYYSASFVIHYYKCLQDFITIICKDRTFSQIKTISEVKELSQLISNFTSSREGRTQS